MTKQTIRQPKRFTHRNIILKINNTKSVCFEYPKYVLQSSIDEFDLRFVNLK